MSGENSRTHDEAQNPPIPAATSSKSQRQAEDDRTGHYGGDDGALEHERTELTTPDTLTPEATEGKAQAERKVGR